MGWRGIKISLSSALMLVAVGGTGSAQDRGGVTVSFGVSQSLDHQRRTGEEARTQALTALSFGYLTETRTDQLSFSGGFGLQLLDGPGTDGLETEVINPRVGLSYGRTGAAASLTASANYTADDIDFLRPLTDFVDDDGVITPPDDFDDLTGTGTRSVLSYSARLTLRDDRPFGITLFASGSTLDYRDTTDPDLVDSQSLSYGLGLRFDINDVTTARLELSQSRTESDGAEDSESTTLTGSYSIARPLGALSFGLSASETGAGEQFGLSVARDLELSETDAIAVRFGITQAASGDTVLTGALDYRTERPGATIAAQLNRSVTVTSENEERVVTSLAGSYATQLSPSLSLSVNGAFARASETETDTTTDVADLGLRLGYELTRDWDLSVSASRQWRTEDAGTTETTDLISIGLSRSFQWRY